ncbi:MAG: hypothetical protein EX271_02390 [Acidimicrobiales bacterium]|nr:hypothetical protein [Hyphomonadaceae bacterium]RZV44165.1 MAG: hypothetical protein EX271_02390 [Acidimicrobiales bacterium]
MSAARPYANSSQTGRRLLESMAANSILPIERFDHRHGLTSLQVHQTVCSRDGRIWSATPAGLACYDGVSIKMFGHKQGLSSHGLRTLAVSPDDNLWIGTDVGVEVLEISGPAPVVLWSKPIGTVNCLDVVEEFAAIGTSKGLFFWRGKPEIFPSKDNTLAHATITSVLISKAKSIWVIGPVIGLKALSSSEEKRVLPQRRKMIGMPLRLAHGPEGTILIGAERGILNVKENAEIRQLYSHDNPVNSLTYHDGKIFAGAGKNLIRIDPHAISSQNTEIIQEDVVAHHIMIDHFENIWISSGDQSLLKVSGISRTLSGNYDLPIGPIMCVRQGPKGLLIGGSRGLLLENRTIILEETGVWDALVDGYGKVWAATDQGLYCMVNPYFTIPYRHNESDVLAAPGRALCFYEGMLYASSIRGLARVGPEGPQEILDERARSLGYVYSLHIGPKGKMWVATLGRGLWQFDGDKLTRIFKDEIVDNVNVYSICHSVAGDVFVAFGNRISKIDPQGAFSPLIETDDPIAAWSIQCLANNQLAAGSSTGLAIYDAQTGVIINKISGKFDDVPWEFTTSRSLAVLNDNTIYCGLGSGLRTVQLGELAKLDIQPSATLAYAEWRGVGPEKNAGSDICVKQGNWHLEIGIRTCWYLDECTMRERLLGFEDNWSPFRPLHTIRYTALPKGAYTLEVEIRSPLMGVGPVTQIYSFAVI